jgi:3-phosphoglycerate kinase
MKLPSVKDLCVKGKRVLLRTNYDVPLKKVRGWVVEDETRIEESLATIKWLLENEAKVIAVSHLGRPEGKRISELSLRPVAEKLKDILNIKYKIVNIHIRNKKFLGFKLSENLVLLENIRFWPEEEENNLDFAKELASLADFYVNEAFACSHRRHASIVGVPRFFLPQNRAFGFDFLKEVEVLSKIREKPARPVVLLLGGVKEDKIDYAKKLVNWADWILVGGKLVEYDGIPQLAKHPKILADLIKSGQDITMEAIEKFKEIIFKAKTIVWAGPMGNFYDQRYETGTKEIARAVVESGAFSVVGGGDTEVALTRFGLDKKISFISSGGGAMLEFLAEGTLPGIKAILNSKNKILNTNT